MTKSRDGPEPPEAWAGQRVPWARARSSGNTGGPSGVPGVPGPDPGHVMGPSGTEMAPSALASGSLVTDTSVGRQPSDQMVHVASNQTLVCSSARGPADYESRMSNDRPWAQSSHLSGLSHRKCNMLVENIKF